MKCGGRLPPCARGRLLLRAFAESDAGALYACCRNPLLGDNAGGSRTLPRGVAPGAGGGLPPADDVGRDGRRDGAARRGGRVAARPKRECPGVAMLDYWLDEACWGRGLMTEGGAGGVGYSSRNSG